ncbi:MAG: hypothetical protein ACWGOX_09855 [Desulforhopalus sp.]
MTVKNHQAGNVEQANSLHWLKAVSHRNGEHKASLDCVPLLCGSCHPAADYSSKTQDKRRLHPKN